LRRRRDRWQANAGSRLLVAQAQTSSGSGRAAVARAVGRRHVTARASWWIQRNGGRAAIRQEFWQVGAAVSADAAPRLAAVTLSSRPCLRDRRVCDRLPSRSLADKATETIRASPTIETKSSPNRQRTQPLSRGLVPSPGARGTCATLERQYRQRASRLFRLLGLPRRTLRSPALPLDDVRSARRLLDACAGESRESRCRRNGNCCPSANSGKTGCGSSDARSRAGGG
jgi:hypothetical protein